MDEHIPRAQCGAPAQVTERFRRGRAAGPAGHLKAGCVNSRRLTPRADTLPGAQPLPIPAAVRPAPEPVAVQVAAMSRQIAGRVVVLGASMAGRLGTRWSARIAA